MGRGTSVRRRVALALAAIGLAGALTAAPVPSEAATVSPVDYLGAGWQLDLALATHQKVVVLACTVLSGSCRSIVPAYDWWATQFPKVTFYLVDIGFASPDLLVRVLKAGLPTTTFFNGTSMIGRVVGPDVTGILTDLGTLDRA